LSSFGGYLEYETFCRVWHSYDNTIDLRVPDKEIDGRGGQDNRALMLQIQG
jgi:hypothetical protein